MEKLNYLYFNLDGEKVKRSYRQEQAETGAHDRMLQLGFQRQVRSKREMPRTCCVVRLHLIVPVRT
jgi:hypothetical protein